MDLTVLSSIFFIYKYCLKEKILKPLKAIVKRFGFTSSLFRIAFAIDSEDWVGERLPNKLGGAYSQKVRKEMEKCTRKEKVMINNKETKIEVFTRKGLYILEFSPEESELIVKYQKQLPQLTQEDNGGFIVDGEILCYELGVKSNFNDWLTRKTKGKEGKLIKYRCVEDKDYKIGKIRIANSDKPKNVISLKLDTAKKIAMRQNNEIGDMVCDYFILMEKAVKRNSDRIKVRQPQKPLNEEINKKVKANYMKKYGIRPNNYYLYSSNADMINLMIFGYKAKDINDLLKEKNDGKTRDRVIYACLERLTFMLSQHIILLDMGMDFTQREQMLLQMYKARYGNKIDPYTGELTEIDYIRPSFWDKKYLV